jgi:hypothetical protein
MNGKLNFDQWSRQLLKIFCERLVNTVPEFLRKNVDLETTSAYKLPITELPHEEIQ